MKQTAKFKVAERSDLLKMFEQIDANLTKKSKQIAVTILGGASLILLGLRNRATLDIDIAGTSGSQLFYETCKKLGVHVDIVTVTSTVDLCYCPTITVYKGNALIVNSVTPKDLLKLKLERFRKQDPEDIYAIIEHESLSFDEFKDIVFEMLPDFIGNKRELILSAQIVVEQIFKEHLSEFNGVLEK